MKYQKKFTLIIALNLISIFHLSVKAFQPKSNDTDLNFDRIYERLLHNYEASKEDTIQANLYITQYLRKAKNRGDKFHIAEGYIYKSFIVKKNRNTAIKYADSAITIFKGFTDQVYPAKAYIIKAGHLYHSNNKNSSLNNFLLARNYALKRNNTSQLLQINHSVGILKNSLNKSQEAIVEFKKNIDLMEKNTDKKDSILYLNTLFGIADGYNRLNITGSGLPYIKKGLKLATELKNKEIYNRFLVSFGINQFLKKNYLVAIDSLEQTLKSTKNISDSIDHAIKHLYIAKSFNGLRKVDSAFYYALQGSKYISTKNYSSEVRGIFELLSNTYERKSKRSEQLQILKQLIYFDSITRLKEGELSSNIIKNFDLKKIIEKKNKLLSEIENSNTQSKFYIWFLLIAVIFLTVYSTYIFNKKKTYKSRFDLLMNDMPKVEIKETINPAEIQIEDLDIPKEIIHDICKKLENFERDLGFLKNSLNLSFLAKEFNTNTAYLSKIINAKKEKNFSNYIKDMRISYAVDQLKKDKKFRKYSIKAISQDVGFNNEKSFSRAFIQNYGISPSYFIKKMQESEVSTYK